MTGCVSSSRLLRTLFVACFALATVITVTSVVSAAGPPPPALPESSETVARKVAKLVALRFARRDAERAAEHAKKLTAKSEAATNKSAEVEKRAADANAAKAAAEKLFNDTIAAIEASEKAKTDGDKKFAEAIKALEEAKKATVEAAARLVALIEKKKQTLIAKQQSEQNAAKVVKEAEPFIAAREAAKKETTEATKQSKATSDRLAALQQDLPAADPESIRLLKTFQHDRPVIACRVDPTGSAVYAGAQDSTLHRWDLFSGSHTSLDGHSSWIRRFDMHASGELLVSGAYAGRVIWWNPLDDNPKPLRTVEAHQGYVRGVAISPDSRFVATCGNDHMVRIWSADTGELVKELAGHERHVYNLKFHPSGTSLVSGDLMGVMKQWDVAEWKHVRDLDAAVLHKYDSGFQADCGGIRGIDYSADGRYLVVAGISEVTNAFAGIGVPTAVLFDAHSGKQLQVMKPEDGFKGTLWSVRMHPSGEFLVGAGGGGNGMLWFWKPDEEKAFFSFKLPSVAYDLDFHPDGFRLAVALYDKTVRLYDLGPQLNLATADASKPAAGK